MQVTPDTPADTIAEMLRRAMLEHGGNRFDGARPLYEQVLAQDPRHPDALHLLGVLEAQVDNFDRAADLIGQALEVRPDEAMFHNNLGNVQMGRARIDDAQACYVRAIEIDPGRIDAMNNLGVLLSRRGQAESAEQLLKTVVGLAPGFADARQNLASHYLREGRLHDAVQQSVDGLVVAPRNVSLRKILGLAYSALGMKQQAIAVYRAWLEAEPGDVRAGYHLQACLGEDVPERAPDDYVSLIFDDFSDSFDAKLAKLSYRAPALVIEAVGRHAGPPARALTVLDAGCGTGLCGPGLAPWALRLVGVDLSEGMLRQAARRAVYDELVRDELVRFLGARPAAFDLIASADTLCYFGTLEGFAQAAAAALRRGGLLVFTVESHAEGDGVPDFVLHPHGRYSHRRTYVDSVLHAAGLQPIEAQPVVLRTEIGNPVDGWLVSARAQVRP